MCLLYGKRHCGRDPEGSMPQAAHRLGLTFFNAAAVFSDALMGHVTCAAHPHTLARVKACRVTKSITILGQLYQDNYKLSDSCSVHVFLSTLTTPQTTTSLSLLVQTACLLHAFVR